MGSGMLFAGALMGGAKAVDGLVDQAYKREDDERKRAADISDRRSALLFEMKVKADYARSEKENDAAVANKVSERGAAIGNERGARELEAARSTVANEGEFANERITPEMIASMPPAARAIYEREMGLTDDSTLQGLLDQVSASNELGAPASVRKGLLDSARDEEKSQKNAREERRKERRDDAKDERDRQLYAQSERKIDNQWALGQSNLAVAQQRANTYDQRGAGGSGGDGAPKVRSTKTNADGEVVGIMSDGTVRLLGIQDHAFAKTVAAAVAKMDGDRKYKNLSEDEKKALVRSRLAGAQLGAQAEADVPAPAPSAPTRPGGSQPAKSPWTPQEDLADRIRTVESEIAKDKASGKTRDIPALERELALLRKTAPTAAQPSAKKDNQATASAPVKVQDKAQYNALPKGARYVAPDGSIRTKG